jgi:hypothetical protein
MEASTNAQLLTMKQVIVELNLARKEAIQQAEGQ